MRFPLLASLLFLAGCSAAPTYDRGVASEDGGLGFAAQDALTRGDTRVGDRYVDAFQVDVVSRTAFGIGVDSGAFTAAFDLVSPSGNVLAVTDCDGSNDACTWIDAGEPGRWMVRVTSRETGESGGYTFTVSKPLPGPVAAATDTGAPLALAPHTPEASQPTRQPSRPTPPEAPRLAPEAPRAAPTLPLPEEVAEPSVEQSISASFNGVDQRYPLDGRQRLAVPISVRLLSGDVVSVRFASREFTPLLVLAYEGDPVETARADAASGGVRTAFLRYEIPMTGTYALYLATPDAELDGAFDASVSFMRDRDRMRQAPEVEPARQASGLAHSQISALRATLEAAPRFGTLRGALLARGESSGDIYASTMPIPRSSQTNVICAGERCSIYAVFPTLDADSAVNTASNLIRIVNTVTDYALDEPDVASNPGAFMELVSDDVSVRVSYDAARYDEALGVPVTLRIDPR